MTPSMNARKTSSKNISESSRSQQHDQQGHHNHNHHYPPVSQLKCQARRDKVLRFTTDGWRFGLLLVMLVIVAREHWLTGEQEKCYSDRQDYHGLRRCLILIASGHIVLTKDDRGQSLILTGEDGKGGKGGKKGGGDQLVIAGNMGGGQNSNMVLQDASNRDGDVVISGNSMVVPGEDGHIVLADNRARNDGDNNRSRGPPPPPNLFALWMPYMYQRVGYRMPMQFFGGNQFGGQFGWG